MGMECCGEVVEERFFDSREEISSIDWSSDGSEDCTSPPSFTIVGYRNEKWRMEPDSVFERRKRFLDWMRPSSDINVATRRNSKNGCLEMNSTTEGRLMFNSGAVLRTSKGADVPPTESLATLPTSETRQELDRRLIIRNLDDGTEFVVDEVDPNGMLCRLRQVGSNFSFSLDEFQRTVGQSPLIQRLFSRYAEEVLMTAEKGMKVKEGWLKKLNVMAQGIDRHGTPQVPLKVAPSAISRLKVSSYKKRSQELSSLFAGQEFLAHKGSIGTMKFSVDGLYLASGGEDGIVRVWKVLEDEKPDLFSGGESSCSCPYCTFQYTSCYLIQNAETYKKKKIKNTDSKCTILPKKIFGVQEKPLYEFRGHTAEILDLSWSKTNLLLSSSTDSTVRLWQVGSDGCLGVFRHTNYVTSVDFNPLDDRYFISGSIDGKVRIWEVPRCRVVGYADIKEIVTVVRYRPTGKGGLVGSVSGRCLFYNLVDNQMQLDTNVCLHGKKNLPSNRITGFQFSPKEPNKVVVTCADSVIRLLSGSSVSCKFKAPGFRVAATQMQASFTPDGQHIVSLSDDSRIYLWNYNGQSSLRASSVRSHESFLSENTSVAIPWSGIQTIPGATLSCPARKDVDYSLSQEPCGELEHKLNRTPDWISLTRGFLMESLAKGSARWNKDKLPIPSPLAISRTKCMAHYKFLRNACQNMLSSSHMWGLVIVTAGLDGRIRTYLNYGLPLRL